MELAVDHPTASRVGSDPTRHALHDVLEQLGERIKPISMAGERTLPVLAAFDGVFPEKGLVRGRVVSCRGGAAASIASALVRDAVVEGAWLAVVDVDTFGADAAAEFGIPLERVVRIETGRIPSESIGESDVASESDFESDGEADGATSELDWVDVMGAAVDGFDVVVTRVPRDLRGERRPAAVRKLATRIQQRGAVVVTLGSSGALGCDTELTTSRSVWSGLGDGVGLLRRRRIDIDVGGRRLPGERTCSLTLAGSAGRVEISASEPATEIDVESATDVEVDVEERDRHAEMLREMADGLGPDTGVGSEAELDRRPLAG